MSIAGIIVALVLVVLLAVYLVLPLLRHTDTDADTYRSKQRERALAYYERVLTNLRDLDDDLATGKIAEAEHALERERWMARGVQLLKMLDELDQKHNITGTLGERASDAEIDEAIETAMQAETTGVS